MKNISKLFDSKATKTFGLSISGQLAWGIAIPFPTAVDPNFSRLIKVSSNICESILISRSANLVSSSRTFFLLLASKLTKIDFFKQFF